LEFSTMMERGFDDCTVRISAPVEVGRAPGHHWFPTLHPVTASDILCEAITTADRAQGKWPGRLYLSRDGGGSWRLACGIESCGLSSLRLGPRKILLIGMDGLGIPQARRIRPTSADDALTFATINKEQQCARQSIKENESDQYC